MRPSIFAASKTCFIGKFYSMYGVACLFGVYLEKLFSGKTTFFAKIKVSHAPTCHDSK